MGNLFEKIDNRVTAAKIEQGIDMLQSKSDAELARRLQGVNREELMRKIREIDAAKLKQMHINVQEIRNRLTPADLAKIRRLAGKDGDTVMRKLGELLGSEPFGSESR